MSMITRKSQVSQFDLQVILAGHRRNLSILQRQRVNCAPKDKSWMDAAIEKERKAIFEMTGVRPE